jgi:bacterioferritin (cytochrome b1)
MKKFNNEKDREEILRHFEINMNEEFRATLQYICHRISARETDTALSESFKSAALDEMSHILFFSDIITKYGGTPKFTPWDIDQSSDIKTMLKKDIELEKAAIKRYENQIETIKDYSDLTAILDSVMNDEMDHETDFRAYLDKIIP